MKARHIPEIDAIAADFMRRISMNDIDVRKHTSISGSVYIRTFNGRARTIRISDHPPHDPRSVHVSIHPGSNDTLEHAFRLARG